MPRAKQTETPSRQHKKRKGDEKKRSGLIPIRKKGGGGGGLRQIRKKTRKNEKEQATLFYKNSNVHAGHQLIKLVYAVCDHISGAKKPTTCSLSCATDMSETAFAIGTNLFRGCDKTRSRTNTKTHLNFTVDSYFDLNPQHKGLLCLHTVPAAHERVDV